MKAKAPAVLVVDVGGTNVKVRASGQKRPRKIPSGPDMTPARMARAVKLAAAGWKYDRVAIGYPGPVRDGHPAGDPINLGRGWKRFDYKKAFGRPVRLINDALMQALGSYRGGRMLFLGLGTGLGSALIAHGALVPLELGQLLRGDGRTFEDLLGRRGLERLGKKRWRRKVLELAPQLRDAFQADELVIGGGNAKKLKSLPPGARRVDNDRAFVGGLRLWTEVHAGQEIVARKTS